METRRPSPPAIRDRYSLGRAILHRAGLWSGPCPEAVAHRQLERDVPDQVGRDIRGFFVPDSLDPNWYDATVDERAVLSTKATNAGAELVFESDGPLVAAVRARSVAARLGATFLTGLRNKIGIVRINNQVQLAWEAEDPGTDTSESTPTTGRETLEPHTLRTFIPVTRQLVQQAAESMDAELLLRAHIGERVAATIDRAAFSGTGADDPTGLLNRGDISEVAIGVDGGAPTWATIVDLEHTASDADGDVDPATAAFAATSGVRKKLRTTEKAAGSGFVWEDDRVAGYPGAVSSALPSTLTKGTGTDLHAIAFAAGWSQLVVARWGPGLELIVDPYTQVKRGIIEIVAVAYVDIGVLRPESFALVVDADVS